MRFAGVGGEGTYSSGSIDRTGGLDGPATGLSIMNDATSGAGLVCTAAMAVY